MTILRFAHTVAMLLLGAVIAPGQDTGFSKTKLLALEKKKQKLTDVSLRFGETGVTLTEKKSSRPRLEIPYASVTNISYEMAKRHRIAEGTSLMILSLGAGAVLMATKTKSHWLAIEYAEGQEKKTAILQLHKDEYGPAISACESKYGKKVQILAEGESKANPTLGSDDVDEVVQYPLAKVKLALKPAMEKLGCAVTEEKADEVECKRGRSYNEVTGGGGEKITAKLESQGESTRVKIETGKGFVGRMGKKDWSTPIYRQMMETLKGS